MRYRQLAVGVCVSMATSYGWNLGKLSNRTAYALQTDVLSSASLINQVSTNQVSTNQVSQPNKNNYLTTLLAQNTSDTNAIRLNSIRPATNGLMLNVDANPQLLIYREL